MFVIVGQVFCHACTSMTILWQNQDSHTCVVIEVFHDNTKIIITEVDRSVFLCAHSRWRQYPHHLKEHGAPMFGFGNWWQSLWTNGCLELYLKYIGQVMLDGFKGDKYLGSGGCLASCQTVGIRLETSRVMTLRWLSLQKKYTSVMIRVCHSRSRFLSCMYIHDKFMTESR